MELFIDTNVFLSFYHYANDDLEELDKLSALLRQEDVTLHLPHQVIDEFDRNRENKINDALKKLKKQSLNLQFPQVCKDYDQYEHLRDLQRRYAEEHDTLIENIQNDVRNESLKADSTVDELFEEADVYSVTGEIIDRARDRMDIGNPPGKDGSLGDAINWELLLDEVPDEEDLYLITEDKDYFSPFDRDCLNSFLVKEWKEVKETDIIFYKRLSSFFEDNFPNIRLASEFEKELLINRFAETYSFSRTHEVVSDLRRYSEFTASQVNDIVEAAISNSQISRIIEDRDVKGFLNTVLENSNGEADDDSLNELYELLGRDREETENG